MKNAFTNIITWKKQILIQKSVSRSPEKNFYYIVRRDKLWLEQKDTVRRGVSCPESVFISHFSNSITVIKESKFF